jgi:sulfoxide reductase heme-binding subunit YedZ
MSSPSPIWYAGRGLGLVLLLLLTATVVLGVLTSQRWAAEGWPRFVTAGLHRNLALLAVALLPLHGLAMVLDSYAHLGLKDITVPFSSSYRPLWLGLGVLGGELMVMLAVTSLIRNRLGYRIWKAIHWLAYLSWPLALLHGLGTGSDTRQAWALLAYGLCVASVLVGLLWRLARSGPSRTGWRLAAALLSVAGTLALGLWAAAGPLRAGWAAAAGTPANLIGSRRLAVAGPTARPASTPALPAGLDDRVRGTASQTSGGGLEIDLVDLRDGSLRVTIFAPDPEATAGLIRVTEAGATICSAQAAFNLDVTASCGGVSLQITLAQLEGGALVGELRTTAP